MTEFNDFSWKTKTILLNCFWIGQHGLSYEFHEDNFVKPLIDAGLVKLKINKFPNYNSISLTKTGKEMAELAFNEHLPKPGTKWETKDGRIVEVVKWLSFVQRAELSALMSVVNAKPGQKKTTEMNLLRFGDSLKPVEEQQDLNPSP